MRERRRRLLSELTGPEQTPWTARDAPLWKRITANGFYLAISLGIIGLQLYAVWQALFGN
ncbi:hypothetical protein DFO45_2315 [Azorhizobium sp. AG788]|nr:hypothetical protein DFO45_2315 [Azorhizobium sp. AG788]